MNYQTIAEKEKSMKIILREVREIKKTLSKFLLMIPEESIKKYKNISGIKGALGKAVKLHPPSQ